MRHKRLHSGEERLFVLVLEPGEEVVSTLLDFARREKLSGARFSAVGALSDAVLGYFQR
jgi:predicted DNA-binding protein with PD1-like motif